MGTQSLSGEELGSRQRFVPSPRRGARHESNGGIPSQRLGPPAVVVRGRRSQATTPA
jgi:hypothetical protein